MAIDTVRVKVDGTWVTLTKNQSTGKFEGQLAAPNKTSYNVNAGHYYPVTVEAKDLAGNTTSVTRTVYLDTVAPVVESITIVPNPVNVGQNYVITVEVSD